MDDRSLIRFIVSAVVVTVLWYFIFVPLFGLNQKPPANKNNQPIAEVKDDAVENNDGADANTDAVDEVSSADNAAAESDETAAEDEPAEAKVELEKFPSEKLMLGTLEPESPYYLQVELNTVGASVEGAWLNDPRYKRLADTTEPLQILGSDPLAARNSFELSVAQIDDQLVAQGTSLTEVDWKIAKKVEDEDHQVLKEVVFQYPAPDKSFLLEKRYWLEPVTTQEGADPASHDVRDTRPSGYFLRMEVRVRNNQQKPESIQYRMLGPVGVPLENRIATYKWRDVKFQSEVAENDFETSTVSASEIVGDDAPGPWTNYLRFVGVDVQYFAALVFTEDKRPYQDRTNDRWLKQVEPVTLARDPDAQFSDVTFSMLSQEHRVDAGKDLVHHYNIYLGPKRDDLLEPIQAESIMEVWSWISWLSKPMMWLLTRMHESLGFPYWLAIICLTVIVRGCLHPITRKQMASAKRMKELQPKIQELKKKYGNDREKFAQAQMALYREHNFNPLAGCLPVLLQMPIFFALYQGLRSTVDLRLAEFLWIDNLAAPDMLFTTGLQNLPLLDDYFYYFNLLPVITVGLFMLTNKLLMPQPDPNDEMAVMTSRMMKYMMVMMGFMFYHVPSGLCVYFITSSIWSLCERKMIDFQHNNKPAEVLDESPSTIRPHNKKQAAYPRNGDKKEAKEPGKVGGLWSRILEAAEAQQQLQREKEKASKPGVTGKKKKKKR